MATSKSHHFQLIEGMELQITVTGLPNGSSVRAEFYLKNCTGTWLLQWGCIYQGNNNWFIPSEHSTKEGALQTPFVKSGNAYVVILELRDPKVLAIEFVLKDGNSDRWLKQNTGNFRVEIPWNDLHASHQIPKNLIESRAYKIWERRGRPQSSAREEQIDKDNALRELQAELARGISIDDLQANSLEQHTGNFRVEISRNDLHASHQIPKNLIESRAYKIWERRGRPQSSAREEQIDKYNALRELQVDLARGLSIEDLQANSDANNSAVPVPRGVISKGMNISGNYVISSKEFTSEKVGSKSCNIIFLRERVPSWIKIPTSVALPFGTFENALSYHSNTDVARKISSLKDSLNRGDMTKLKAIQEAVLQMRAPMALRLDLIHKLESEKMSFRGDEAGWNRSWMAIKKVWASKWNERAYVSCKKNKLDHDAVCMAVLVQEVICGDYAFVIHTKNHISGDSTEIYTEIVKGLGETLVGAYPGLAMSFMTKKTNLKSPTVINYPSKRICLYSKPSIIFRSDSNNEDLEGYAGAGLYDSVIMDEAEKVVVDYSTEQLIVDKAFQVRLFSAIAEAGNVIETLYGCPQDIEGVVKGGNIYVVQARPQL